MDIHDRLMLLVEFPELTNVEFKVTSKQTMEYNCIAWAAGEDDRWWWPDRMNQKYWPKGVPRETTITAFIAAYRLLGYECCDSLDLEIGLEKVAIFADEAKRPTHAARQLEDGYWTSKLGNNFDISHELTGISGEQYGKVVQVMRRRRTKN